MRCMNVHPLTMTQKMPKSDRWRRVSPCQFRVRIDGYICGCCLKKAVNEDGQDAYAGNCLKKLVNEDGQGRICGELLKKGGQ